MSPGLMLEIDLLSSGPAGLGNGLRRHYQNALQHYEVLKGLPDKWASLSSCSNILKGTTSCENTQFFQYIA